MTDQQGQDPSQIPNPNGVPPQAPAAQPPANPQPSTLDPNQAQLLAPPLGSPYAPHQPPQAQPPQIQPPMHPQPQLPPEQQSPYAVPLAPGIPTPQYAPPQMQPPTFGAAGGPGQNPQKKKTGILIGSILGGVLLVTAATVTVVVLLSGQSSADTTAAPSSTTTDKATPAPTKTPESEPEPQDSNDGERVFGPNDPEIEGTGPIGERIEAFQAQLKQSYDDGTLWQKIPETKENTGAYLAMQFILTDMKSATRFGPVSDADATQWAKQAKYMENQLLAQRPLGSSVKYTMQDGKVFEYNGDTGEVSLSDPKG
ncbi:hypothetical protein G7068_09605 [Leucobacter viscericola]|uniref:Uncharacterized protein n=1 Tax=Leucobacter viscericola TaxID=2714935 RepID=A0A6G7XG30_9MICO|nr:hypothetical protein [Leucobacter viscericola]QIK63426.1 hypothetical protein G7068_09605 [Leucobacter viscericola]